MTNKIIYVGSVEHFMQHPQEYDVVFSSLLGWLLKYRNSETSEVITEQKAFECIAHIKASDPTNPFFGTIPASNTNSQ